MILSKYIPPMKRIYQLIIFHYVLTTLYKIWKLSQNKHCNPRIGAEKGYPRSNKVTKDYITSTSGVWLFTRRWLPEHNVPLKGIIFIAHGLGEHISRYGHVADQLTQSGYLVFGLDHQGHGRSEGDRCYVEKFDDFANDFVNYVQLTLREKITRHGPSGKATTVSLEKFPRYLLGHSMGGLVALRSVKLSEGRQLKWDGVILSAPALSVDPTKVNPMTIKAAHLLSRIVPKFKIEKLDSSTISRNPLIISHYNRDPLNYRKPLRVRIVSEIMKAMKVVHEDAKSFETPILFAHGEADKLTLPQGTTEYHAKCGSEDKTLRLYPGLYHEILNSDVRDEIIGDLIKWLDTLTAKVGLHA